MNGLLAVKEERTGWRDKKFDDILEKNGIPQVKSFLVTEYSYGKSVAMIEYKKYGSSTDADDRLIQYCNLRKNEELYFIVLYDYEKNENQYKITKLRIHPKNQAAMKKYGKEPIEMNELSFIDFLYDIRKNSSSKYRKKAHQEYDPWFNLNITFDEEKQVISKRHRSYAYDVPAADIDCMLCDGDNTPYLFIEYKENNNYGKITCNGHNSFVNENISQETMSIIEDKSHKLYNKAITDLGDGCKIPIPVLVVEYHLQQGLFSIYALNKSARERVQLGTMRQKEYFKYIKNSKNFKDGIDDHTKQEIKTCPKCGGSLELKNGIYGKFYGCNNFKSKNCRYTEKYRENI